MEYLEQIKNFVESDCVDLTNALVINSDGEVCERYSFGARSCLEATDQELLVISFKGHLIADDCCEGCEFSDFKDGEYICLEKDGEKFDCVLDMIKQNRDAYQQYLIDKQEELRG